MNRYGRLFEPFVIGKTTLRNRIIFPAMVTNYANEDGSVTDRSTAYYEARSRGGAGMVIIEGASIDQKVAKPITRALAIDDDRLLPGLSRLAGAIRKHGALPVMQIYHGGRQDDSNITGNQPVAPSPVRSPSGMMARELTKKDIERLIVQYAEAAARARKAGFGGIEVHAGHGVLPAQFLSPIYNQRTDGYGGSLENRARFLLELMPAMRDAVGADFPVWCRINGMELAKQPGFGIEDAKKVSKMLERAGADAIHVSAYGHAGLYWKTTMPDLPGRHIPLAEAVKKVVGIPVIAVGRITPELAEKALAENKADLISMGRAMIADPDLVSKLQSGREEDIDPCISCHYCVHTSVYGTGLRCTVNPVAGREGEASPKAPGSTKKIVVVGGGPAGMKAAAEAAARGHEVVLYEKDRQLGGQLIPAAVPPGKDRIAPFTRYLANQLKKSKVEVRLGEGAGADLLSRAKPDVVIVATGVDPFVPSIEGIDRSSVVNASDVLTGKVKTGGKVVVIGGDLVGCETAMFLADQGKKVTITRRGEKLATKVFAGIRSVFLDEVRKRGIAVLTGVKYVTIGDNGLTVITSEGKETTIEADTIVLAAGAAPNSRLYSELQGKVPGLSRIGDAAEPRSIAEAVYEGWRAGREL